MRSEYIANIAMQQTNMRGTLAPVSRKPKLRMGWNGKAFVLALGFFVTGMAMQSKGCMGVACVILCFGIRPYWR